MTLWNTCYGLNLKQCVTHSLWASFNKNLRPEKEGNYERAVFYIAYVLESPQLLFIFKHNTSGNVWWWKNRSDAFLCLYCMRFYDHVLYMYFSINHYTMFVCLHGSSKLLEQLSWKCCQRWATYAGEYWRLQTPVRFDNKHAADEMHREELKCMQ